jgi:putative uncharacterized protein (fragment)
MLNNMGRFKYTDSEKETLRVLKMQEQQLAKLQENITCDNAQHDKEELAVLRDQIENMLQKRGVYLSNNKDKSVPEIDIKVKKSDIPTWSECAAQADEVINEDVEFEDLLSQEEFNYCIEDVERINAEFSAKTGILNKKDLSFLMVATALQTARWLIIQKLCGDLGKTIDNGTRLEHNDKKIKDSITKSNKKFQEIFESYGHRESLKSYKSWEQIIFSSAPYDVTIGSPKFSENLEGKYHRYKTLGHDPILGWIFGTANFITDTCTLSNFNSYRISRQGTPHFAEPTNLASIFYEVFDSVKEDWLRLPAGLFAQFVHLKSDVFTKLGLPVPVLEVFSESLAGDLYKSQYDSLCLMKDIAIVGNQAIWSIFINMIISLVHGFFYDANKDGDRKLYEVRTRKILCLSNSLASTGNIAYAVATNDWRKLDAGGILVSLYRLFTDVGFITRVKEEFINREMDEVLKKELIELDSYFI